MIVMNTYSINHKQLSVIHTCINDDGTIIINYTLLHRFLYSVSMYTITTMSNTRSQTCGGGNTISLHLKKLNQDIKMFS